MPGTVPSHDWGRLHGMESCSSLEAQPLTRSAVRPRRAARRKRLCADMVGKIGGTFTAGRAVGKGQAAPVGISDSGLPVFDLERPGGGIVPRNLAGSTVDDVGGNTPCGRCQEREGPATEGEGHAEADRVTLYRDDGGTGPLAKLGRWKGTRRGRSCEVQRLAQLGDVACGQGDSGAERAGEEQRLGGRLEDLETIEGLEQRAPDHDGARVGYEEDRGLLEREVGGDLGGVSDAAPEGELRDLVEDDVALGIV